MRTPITPNDAPHQPAEELLAGSRSLVLGGLRLVLSRFRAVFWTYAFNLGLALLFSLRLSAQLNDILAHSLASERLSSAFDLGVVADATLRLNRDAPGTGLSNALAPLCFFAVYFLLVPGTLFCYTTGAPARLAILLSTGVERFWRFLRVTLLNAFVSGLILGPLLWVQSLWATHVDLQASGRAAFLENLPVYLLLALVAATLRLYFDLVEIYTVLLGQQTRPDGRPDRRVRCVLLPALRTLGSNFGRALGSFLLFAGLGLTALVLSFRAGLHTLAQPRTWPAFLLAQVGLFLLLFSRFCQRGAETVLAMNHPLPTPWPHASAGLDIYQAPPPLPENTLTLHRVPTPAWAGPPVASGPTSRRQVPESIPAPEPPSLSPAAPDAGVFHHEPGDRNPKQSRESDPEPGQYPAELP